MSRSMTTASERDSWSISFKLEVGIPKRYDRGASTNSSIASGSTGIYGNAQSKGYMRAVITSATIDKFAMSWEWITILHSVNTAANNMFKPSAPRRRHTIVTDAPCGRGGRPADGGRVRWSRSP